MDERAIERRREIEKAVADVRAIEREHGVIPPPKRKWSEARG